MDFDLFGGMFDFNGDGETDYLEAATGFMILDGEEKRKKKDDGFYDFGSDDEDCDGDEW